MSGGRLATFCNITSGLCPNWNWIVVATAHVLSYTFNKLEIQLIRPFHRELLILVFEFWFLILILIVINIFDSWFLILNQKSLNYSDFLFCDSLIVLFHSSLIRITFQSDSADHWTGANDVNQVEWSSATYTTHQNEKTKNKISHTLW